MNPFYEFIQTPIFSARLDESKEPGLLEEIEVEIANNPHAGSLLGGGIRKVRIASTKRSEGKRGGYRIWYFYQTGESIYLLFLIDKRKAPDLMPDQEKLLIRELKLVLSEVNRGK
ncbi:MAG TPA: type II toxin-antitoxin system RelE/ParE family toxin [bacterium]|jgi:hypothetical protein|nr:type II toxin-antitoxin system RelE/ParE family toxin [bacterium]